MKKIIPLLICLWLLIGFTAPASAMIPVGEAELIPTGLPGQNLYEVNADGAGNVWVTDINGEIWQVEATSGKYTRYTVTYPTVSGISFPSPVDARGAGDYFYWADNSANLLGRAKVSDGSYLVWPVTVNAEAVGGFYGTAVDGAGRLWATDWYVPRLFSLEIGLDGKGNLCRYDLQASTTVNYLSYRDGSLWFSVSTSGDPTPVPPNPPTPADYRFFRLDVTPPSADAKKLDYWTLPDGSDPFGLAAVDSGHVWFADQGKNEINQIVLGASSTSLLHYPVPNDPANIASQTYPWMLALQGSKVWLTGKTPEIIGLLDPAAVTPTETTLAAGSRALTPDCATVDPVTFALGEATSFAKATGTLSWTGRDYTTILFSAGWKYFQVPADDPIGPYVWGIAAVGPDVFVVDNGRSKLLKTSEPPSFNVYLPLIQR